MNEVTQLKIIELIDNGATPDNSIELEALISSSAEANSFYQSVLYSESKLKEYFGVEIAASLDAKIDAFIEKRFERPKHLSNSSFKSITGLAIAASLAFIALTFIDFAPKEESLKNNPTAGISLLAQTEVEPESTYQENEPLTILGSEMNTLWSTATEMAKELGVDRYEIMYVVYEGNKDSFVDFDINQPREDKDYFVDLSLIEDLETQFIINEVKRHIYCRC